MHAVTERPVVVALGGNAIAPPGGHQPLTAQLERTRETAGHLARLGGHPLVVTHGNGPQVGDLLLANELAAPAVPRLPLDACVACTQGGMGFMLQQCLEEAFRQAGTPRPVAAVVTRTLVDPDDPAFRRPSKPVGGTYEEGEARRLAAEHGWVLREDPGRGWRRVVPSPEPRAVLELDVVRALLAAGVTVVAAGGGGIPVARRDGRLEGVEAVVDKDLATALLAAELGAEVLLVLTGVGHVALDYGTPAQRDLHEVSAAELAGYARQGHFPPGSMLPKVEAALRFLAAGGRRVAITAPELAEKALAGTAGTQVTP